MSKFYLRHKRKTIRGAGQSYSINVIHRLTDREHGWDRSKDFLHGWEQPWHVQQELSIFKSLTPNFTIQNVDKPYGYLRKFTPNGRLLLAFSTDQRSLEIYGYRSVGALAELLENEVSECITASDHSQQSLHIRQQAFQRLFVLRRRLRMQEGIPGGYLNREFSIFLDNGHYMLIASMGVSTDPPPVDHVLMYPDLVTESELFFYNFYLVDLEEEIVSDVISYKCDSIQLSLNHGVSAYHTRFAISSKYRQCIDIYEIHKGKLLKTFMIGPNGSHIREGDDLLNCVGTFDSLPITHLKQRILTFLYRQCCEEEEGDARRFAFVKFYRNFPRYEIMIIAKMQLVKKYLLLIRYEQHPRSSLGLKLYAFYDFKKERIVNVFDENSVELLKLIRNNCDEFRNVRSYPIGLSPTSNSNNIYQRAVFDETVAMLEDEAPNRLNPSLPISTQSFITSPYLDTNLFLYDDRQIATLDRPRINTLNFIRFRDRRTRRLLYCFHLESNEMLQQYSHQHQQHFDAVLSRRDMVAFIFHPFEPFVISVQKLLQRYVINFHVYNKSTNVG